MRLVFDEDNEDFDADWDLLLDQLEEEEWFDTEEEE